MTLIRMLGIDPSLTHTGYCVAEVNIRTLKIERVIEKGTVVTAPSKLKQVRKSSDDVARARLIASTLREVITRNQIKVGSSEIPSGAQSANAAKAFGIAIGILASLTIPLIEMSPREVKMATAGTATADKEDIVRWAVELTAGHPITWAASKRVTDWGIMSGGLYVQKTVEHEADSIAGVHAAINSSQFQQLAAMMISLI